MAWSKQTLDIILFKVLDKKVDVNTSEEADKRGNKNKLLLDKNELYDNLLQQLKETREITINDQLLESFDLTQ